MYYFFSSSCAHLFFLHLDTAIQQRKHNRKVIGSTLARCQIHSFTVPYQTKRSKWSFRVYVLQNFCLGDRMQFQGSLNVSKYLSVSETFLVLSKEFWRFLFKSQTAISQIYEILKMQDSHSSVLFSFTNSLVNLLHGFSLTIFTKDQFLLYKNEFFSLCSVPESCLLIHVKWFS